MTDSTASNDDRHPALAALPADPDLRESVLLAGFLLENHVECPRCRYDLCNLQAAQCPECGEPLMLQLSSKRPTMTTAWATVIAFLSMGTGLGLPAGLIMMLSGFRMSMFGPIACSSIVFVACIPLLIMAAAGRERFMRLDRAGQTQIATATVLAVGLSMLVLLGALLSIR